MLDKLAFFNSTAFLTLCSTRCYQIYTIEGIVMLYVSWNDKLSIGMPDIDFQHRQLVNLVEDLDNAVRSGREMDYMSNVFGGLAIYTLYHFSTEEKYFAISGFNEAAEHKREHDAFKKEVKDLRAAFESGCKESAFRVVAFLKDWVEGHLKGSDQRYIETFAKHGLC